MGRGRTARSAGVDPAAPVTAPEVPDFGSNGDALDDERVLFTAPHEDTPFLRALDERRYDRAVDAVEVPDDERYVDPVEHFGVDPSDVWNLAGTEPVAPGAPRPSPAVEAEARAGSVEVSRGDDSATVRVDADSAELELEHEVEDDHPASVSADVSLGGEGGDGGTLGGEFAPHHADRFDRRGEDPLTGTGTTEVSVEGEGEVRVGAPRHRSDGRWSVAWSVGATAGATGTGTYHPSAGGEGTGAIGGEAGGELSGVEIFSTEAEAGAWRSRFLAGVGRSTPTGAAAEAITGGHTAGWWVGVPEGTRRGVEVTGQASATVSSRIAGLLSVSAGARFEAQGTAQVTRGAGSTVEVQLGWQRETTGTLGASALGLGVTGTRTGIVAVDTTYELTLGVGDAALQGVLDGHASIPDGAPGVRLTGVTRQDTDRDGESVSFGVGSLGGTDAVTEIDELQVDAAGRETATHASRGTSSFTGSVVGGTFARGTTELTARHEVGSTWLAQSRLRASDGEESREMLARAWGSGTSPGTGDATSSGLWVVTQRWAPADLEALEQALLDGPPEHGPALLEHPVSGLRRALAALPADASPEERQELRARAFAAFVSETGRDGLDLLESIGGVRPEAVLTLYEADGSADGTFLSAAELDAADRRIRDWRTAAEAGADVHDAVQAERDAMQARVDALADRSRYTDLPDQVRSEVAARYNQLVGALDALLVGADTPPEGAEAAYDARQRCRQVRWDVAWDRAVFHDGWGTDLPPGQLFVHEGVPHQGAMFDHLWEQAEARLAAADALLSGGPDEEEARLVDAPFTPWGRVEAAYELAYADYTTLHAAYGVYRRLRATDPVVDQLLTGLDFEPPSIGPRP